MRKRAANEGTQLVVLPPAEGIGRPVSPGGERPGAEPLPGAFEKPAAYYGEARREMLAFVPASAKRVLDVGCGAGRFGAELRSRQGAWVFGIEREPEAAREAARRLDEVRVGDAQDEIAGLPEGHFDCVVFNDVLEHLVDPARMLHEVRRCLADEGLVVCSIPNVRYWRVISELLFAKDWRYVESGVLDATHLRFFTERSLRRLFDDAGYEVLALHGINATRKKKVRLLRALSCGWLSDIVFLEHACVARPRPTGRATRHA